jgi:hypothetical protein
VITVLVFVAYCATCKVSLTYLWYSRDTTSHSLVIIIPFMMLNVSCIYVCIWDVNRGSFWANSCDYVNVISMFRMKYLCNLMLDIVRCILICYNDTLDMLSCHVTCTLRVIAMI